MINMIQLKLLSDEQLQMKTEFNLEAHSGIQKILSGGPDNVIFLLFSHQLISQRTSPEKHRGVRSAPWLFAYWKVSFLNLLLAKFNFSR